MSSLFTDILSTPNSSIGSAGGDFYNTGLFTSDENNLFSGAIADSSDQSYLTGTFGLPTGSSVPSSSLSSSNGLINSLESLIPGAVKTAEGILGTQYSVPQTSAGQYYQKNANGSITTYTLPTSTTSSSISPFGVSATGSILEYWPILAVVGIGLLLFMHKGR